MKILLVYPNIVESPKDISHGLATISSVLKSKGHKLELIDTSFGMSDKVFLEKARRFSPDLVAFTTATNDFEYACHLASLIKKEFPVPIIAGGFHPTIAPGETINKSCFDIVCIGEGEQAISELASSMEKAKRNTKIKNLWFKVKKGNKLKIIKNSVRPLIQDLDSLPFADRDIFDYSKYLDWNHGTSSFISTRGCPFQCTYCINHFLIKVYCGEGKYVRFRSINNLFKEISQVIKKFPEVKTIEFYDDTFTLDDSRVRQFCSRYKEEIGLPFNINARVNAVKPEMFELLKQAGCVRVSIGIESGDDFIRNKILKRNMSDEQIIKTFKAAKKAGLKTYAFNMIGIPFENLSSIKKTIELNRKCQPDYVGVSIFNAFKGTAIYELCKKNNWLREDYSSSYFRDSNIKHPNFSIPKLRRIRNSFGFRVFLSYKPLRAFIDLIDRNLSQFNSYIFIRSKLIAFLGLLK